ncbi:MAG: hypothetical protein R6V83_05500 [Candidatus Thorarchaeota archaeon]
MKSMHLGRDRLNQVFSDRTFVGGAIVILASLTQVTLSLRQTDPNVGPHDLLVLLVDFIFFSGVILIADGYVRRKGIADIWVSMGLIIVGVLGIGLYIAFEPLFLNFVWPHTIALHFYLFNSLWILASGLLIRAFERYRTKENKD